MSEAMKYKLPPLPEPHTSDTEEVGTSPGGDPEYADVSLFSSDQLQAYAIAAIEAQGVPDETGTAYADLHAKWRKGRQELANLTRAHQALKDQLASALPAPQSEELAQWKARALQAEAIVAKFMEPQASVVQQEPTTFLVVCPDCDGTGLDKKDNNYQCSHCHGSGRVEMDLYTHSAPQAKPQPLSDEQIELLMRSIGTTYADDNDERMRNHAEWQRMNHRQIVRAIEAAHGITKE